MGVLLVHSGLGARGIERRGLLCNMIELNALQSENSESENLKMYLRFGCGAASDVARSVSKKKK